LPTGPIHSWPDFLIELEQNILPRYKAHEAVFDRWGIHGRLHIGRAVIFSEVMGRAYQAAGEEVDFYAVRVAIAFHDSARQGNGTDLWEEQSANNCFNYLRPLPQFADDPAGARRIANLVLKHGNFDLSHRIVYDADVLEIMRPCCGNGGLPGFRREVLHFAGPRDPLAGRLNDPDTIRENLVQEAWRFIKDTEDIKFTLMQSPKFMPALLNRLSERKDQYTLLSQVC
jgi:hypothetical protein